jgi:hypothetical protein
MTWCLMLGTSQFPALAGNWTCLAILWSGGWNSLFNKEQAYAERLARK